MTIQFVNVFQYVGVTIIGSYHFWCLLRASVETFAVKEKISIYKISFSNILMHFNWAMVIELRVCNDSSKVEYLQYFVHGFNC